MNAADRIVLPSDVTISPADDFVAEVRERLGAAESDRVITRPRSRARSLVVDAGTAAFLDQFRSPTTVIDAVLRHAAETGEDPTRLLEIVAPLVFRLRALQLLAVDGQASAGAIQPTFAPGARVVGVEIRRCVHIFEDVEVYRVRLSTGEDGALKVLRPEPSARSRDALEREAAILRQLAGAGVPELVGSGDLDERPYLLQGWCDGIDAARAAASRRSPASAPFSPEVLALCADILRAYVELHGRGVVHGDVHPGNIRIGKDGAVTLLDFGLARSGAVDPRLPAPRRGGLHEYLEPEYCGALLVGKAPPLATIQSDQYALAALLYLLLTGSASQQFSLERERWLEQVAEGRPVPFAARSCTPWPGMESVLARALASKPERRFPSTSEFLDAFERVSAGQRARSWSRPPTSEFLDSILQRVAPDKPMLGEHPIYKLRAPRCSVNYGAAGIAWFLYRASCMRDDPRLLAAADVWCNRARQLADDETAFMSTDIGITREVTGGISPFHSASGIHLVQAHVSRAMGDPDSASRAARAFTEACAEPCDNPDLTLGWTSVLLGCAALAESLPQHDSVERRPVLALGRQVARRIDAWIAERHITGNGDLKWLGLAHGWAGLLFGLLRWTEASGEPFVVVARDRLHELATLGMQQGESISWPLTMSGDERDRGPFAGWCHGSAGYVLLWTLAHRILKDDRFLTLARSAANHIATSIGSEREIDASLCCGYAGQGFALMALHRATGDVEPLRLAGELCDRAVQFGARSTRPDSLYKGDIGVALLIQELTQPSRASTPLVETEGWSRSNA